MKKSSRYVICPKPCYKMVLHIYDTSNVKKKEEYFADYNRRKYKRDWQYRKRHPGVEPPPYRKRETPPKKMKSTTPSKTPKTYTGNEKWIELTRQEREWYAKKYPKSTP